jgi:hypothetical protein
MSSVVIASIRPRHCEPPGRANARPMTGSAKQSISPRKGRMDCFVARAPRNDVVRSRFTFQSADARPPSRGMICPRFAGTVCPLDRRGSRECRVRAAPAVSCAKVHKETHTSIQVQRKHSGIPRAMVLRLISRSPRRRIRLVTVAAGLMAVPIRLDRSRHRQLGTSNGCRDHTVLPYAESAVRPARSRSLTRNSPREQSCAPTLLRPPHPLPRS